MNTIRILLADDHVLVRAGLRALLERLRGIEIAGEANDGREAISMVESINPHVVLMDISMPGLNGLEAIERIKTDHPEVNIIILSASANEEFVTQALRSGAAGYMLKGASPSELEVAIKAVVNGETYLSPVVSKQVIRDYLGRVTHRSDLFELLTQRQREILQLIGEGKSTKDIARILTLSAKTVERHRTELMNRLDIHDVAGLTRYAIKNKLVSIEEVP
ncbi:MAG: response regulator [Acidobacteriota bacterium]